MENPIEQQNKFVGLCMTNMLTVLTNCNREKQDCACSIQVSYVDDPTLPENARFKTSIYCAKRGDPFFDRNAKNLSVVNDTVDILK